MDGQTNDESEPIDRETSRLISDAVGQGLRENLRPERSRFSSYLARLMDELRRRDIDDGPMSS
jgi:hypothetical protein